MHKKAHHGVALGPKVFKKLPGSMPWGVNENQPNMKKGSGHSKAVMVDVPLQCQSVFQLSRDHTFQPH